MSPSSRKGRVCEILEATEGGTREHLRQIARHVDRERFELTFVVSNLRDPAFAKDIADMRGMGHTVHVAPMRRAVRPWCDLVAAVRIWRVLRRGRFDVVHTHSSKAGMLGRVAAWAAGVPARLHTPHVLPFEQETPAPVRWLYRGMEAVAGRLTTTFIALSEHERGRMVETGVARPDQVAVLHNGVESAEPATPQERGAKRGELGLSPTQPAICCVGRLVPQKGHRYLIEAVRRVVDAVPDAVCVVVGEGPLRQEVEGQVRRLGLGESVRLVGQREDVRELLPAFDALALPSLWEAMPYTVLEAMAAGLPVAAFDVSGLGEFIRPGDTGVLVPPRDSAALADALLGLLQEPSLRSRMGDAAREAARERFSVGQFVAGLERLYSGEPTGPSPPDR